ncbi:MAG: hypothetical protein M1840_002682 [Geoglossum simile]|nr:MAG: hypothetical protein M1840_002682 [Geoglossum simile]
MHQWTRSNGLWNHIESHTREHAWPSICPHPRCDIQLDTATSFRYHLSDIHGFQRQLLSGRGKRHQHKEKEVKLELNPDDNPKDQSKKCKRKRGDGGWQVRKKGKTEIQEMGMSFAEWRRPQPSTPQSKHPTTRMEPYPNPIFDDLASSCMMPHGATTESEGSAWSLSGLSSRRSSKTLDTEILPVKGTNDDIIDPLLRDNLLLGAREQSETPDRVQRKQKSMRLKETVEIDYSPPYSPKPLSAFTDPMISPTLTLLPSASPPARDCNHNAECLTAPDSTYISTSLPNGTTSCRTEICTSTKGDYDRDDSRNPPRVDCDMNGPNEETQVNSKEFRDIPLVDLTEDTPVAYDDLLSQYTTISSSTCPSVKGVGDGDDSKTCSPFEIESLPTNTVYCNPGKLNDTQVEHKKPSIKLRLNPPKPKIILRVKQPEQVSSQKPRDPVGRSHKNPAPIARILKQKRRGRR